MIQDVTLLTISAVSGDATRGEYLECVTLRPPRTIVRVLSRQLTRLDEAALSRRQLLLTGTHAATERIHTFFKFRSCWMNTSMRSPV